MPQDSRLTSLADPTIIETVSAEDILAELIADVIDRFDAASVDYDVGNLETDPVKIILEAAAYREVNLRARVNDAAVRANLLAFADGDDLDQLAAFYGVTRLEGESDGALFSRTRLAIAGRSAAGPEERYAYVARSANVLVRDVAVYKVNGGPTIRIAVRSTDNGGVPSESILNDVESAVTASDVAVVSDVIEVVAATSVTANVAADIWLLPDTPYEVFEGLENALAEAWDTESGLGFDLNPSWLQARLHVPGVSRVQVTAPAAPVVVDDNNAVALGSITLNFAGRSR